MIQTAVLGFPRIGENRELKKATESFWKGQLSESQLQRTAKDIRAKNWQAMKSAGTDILPSNDFSFYDQILDMTALLGAVPARYGWSGGEVDLKTYFAMARGSAGLITGGVQSTPAMEMTKWFDTNYHYIVPEFYKGQKFKIASIKPFAEFQEALALGIQTRPVLIGPVTYLLLGKSKEKGFQPLSLIDALLPVYVSILKKLKGLGAESIQIDEPSLILDLSPAAKSAFKKAYTCLAKEVPGLDLMLTTYFGPLHENLSLVKGLPVSGLHVDLVREGSGELPAILRAWPKDRILSLGLVDGRNIWKADLKAAIAAAKPAFKTRGCCSVIIASSCSLLHVPLDLSLETGLDKEIKNWLAFAKEKLAELNVIRTVLNEGERKAAKALKENSSAIASRRKSKQIHLADVKRRLAKVTAKDLSRKSPFKIRQTIQGERLGLPAFPTTTIGSFPQTAEVRAARARFKAREMTLEEYNDFLKEKTQDAVNRQIEMGLDVLVHGEFERNDMVEYFGEQLDGFTFTRNGWVQSYGSRYVKPPVIFGDVRRPRPMTVTWSEYAQSLTERPMKGMLTGPITILQWSFVRNDQPRSATAKQIALAIRDEVRDLESAGIKVIQIDEPAIREGLPLRKKDWPSYLKWAVDAFRLSSAGVENHTQIHTHMCYSEFNDIIQAIAAMDADVISIETSRSQMELLDAFVRFRYPNEIGPGVYDIHSPRVPSVEEMTTLLKKAVKVLPARNLWVNPDCGLKTRGWEETTIALKNMVAAARAMRLNSNSYKKELIHA